MVGHPPADGVRQRQPAEKAAHLSLMARPDHKMPVVAHHAVRQDRQRFPLASLDQNPLKSREVLFRAMHDEPAGRPVHDVVNQTRRDDSRSSSHPQWLAPATAICNTICNTVYVPVHFVPSCKRLLNRFRQLSTVELEVPGKRPDVEEVLHAAVERAEFDHRFKLFRHDGFAVVGVELRPRLIENRRIAVFHNP